MQLSPTWASGPPARPRAKADLCLTPAARPSPRLLCSPAIRCPCPRGMHDAVCTRHRYQPFALLPSALTLTCSASFAHTGDVSAFLRLALELHSANCRVLRSFSFRTLRSRFSSCSRVAARDKPLPADEYTDGQVLRVLPQTLALCSLCHAVLRARNAILHASSGGSPGVKALRASVRLSPCPALRVRLLLPLPVLPIPSKGSASSIHTAALSSHL